MKVEFDEKILNSELDELKNNLFEWYNFKKTDSILLIGNIDNSVIQYFCKKFNKVTLIKNDNKQINRLCSIIEETSNLNLIITQDLDIIKNIYDYAVLIEGLDYRSSNIDISNYISNIKNKIDDNGALLVIEKNRFGTHEIVNKTYNGFSKDRMQKILDNVENMNSKFYYLFPKKEQVNIIFTDKFYPSKNDFRRNCFFSKELSSDGLEENVFLANIVNNEYEYNNYANHFFIEVAIQNSKENAVFYNNLRLKEHRLITKIYDDYALKTCYGEMSKEHLKSIGENISIIKSCGINSVDTFNDFAIKSQINKEYKRLDLIIEECINKDKFDLAVSLIDRFKRDVLEKLQVTNDNIFDNFDISIEENIKNKLNFVKYGLWDFVLHNVLYFEDKFYIYDQEWRENAIPIEFIIFRSINMLENISNESKKRLIDYFNLNDFIYYFNLLELRLQSNLTNDIMYKMYCNSLQKKVIKDDKYDELYDKYMFQAKLVKSKEFLYNMQKEKCNIYEEKNRLLNQNNNELNQIKNSNEYRMALALRRVPKSVMSVGKIGIRSYRFFTRKVKFILKLPKKCLKFIYSKVPKKYRRKFKNKVGYSRKLSKITGIPMLNQYNNNNMKLYDSKSNLITNVCSQLVLNKTIGIHLHLYYDDLAEEFYNYLSNIPYKFDLYISIRKDVKIRKIRKIFKRILNLDKLVVKHSENCGRDFGPMFVLFANDLRSYDYIMHIHSKKSLRKGAEQSDWRQYLLNNLLGSPERVMKCFYLMETLNYGLVYPDAHESIPYWSYMWLDEAGLARDIYARLNIKFKDEFLEFSAGSMFWAKKEALEPILSLNLTWEDFGKDKNQTGGTLEYVFEKIPGIIARNQNYNIAIYNQEKNIFLANKGEKNLKYYYSINLENTFNELNKYDIITFDIFDTLITRKILNPDDIFRLIEKELSKLGILNNYFDIRKKAELDVRIKKNFENDCSIDEIYSEFKELTDLSEEKINEIKELEINYELKFCIPRRDILKLFNKLIDANKKIILISDMYLKKEHIQKILNNCGYYNYYDILVSSEVGCRKDNGTMWEYFNKKYGNANTIHVGDNEEADIHRPLEMGRNVYYLMQGKKMFNISNYAISKEYNLDESVMLGAIVNKGIFNSPFSMYDLYNNSIINSEFSYGYSIIGPILLEFILWLLKNSVENRKREVILFAAREGYYLQKIYDHIVERLNIQEYKDIEKHYLYISRRAITVAQIEKIEDVYEIIKKSYKGTLRELLYYRLGFEDFNSEEKFIELPRDFELVKDVIDRNKEKILAKALKEKSNYLTYIDSLITDRKNKDLTLIDLGYSGTAQYYLSMLLKQKVAGKYFAVSTDIKPLKINCKVESCFNDDILDINEINSNPIFAYSILLEAFLTAPQGQLQYFDKDENGVFPVFNFDDNSSKKDAFEIIYKSAIEYIDDVFDVYGKDILDINFDKSNLLNIYNSFVKESKKLNSNMKKIFDIDDYYCSNGVINGLDFLIV